MFSTRCLNYGSFPHWIELTIVCTGLNRPQDCSLLDLYRPPCRRFPAYSRAKTPPLLPSFCSLATQTQAQRLNTPAINPSLQDTLHFQRTVLPTKVLSKRIRACLKRQSLLHALSEARPGEGSRTPRRTQDLLVVKPRSLKAQNCINSLDGCPR